jgi:hypothetical protein
LTARLEKTKLSDKMIDDDLSRVEESATKSTYKLGVVFERCDVKGEKSAPKFFLALTTTKRRKHSNQPKTHYPSNPKREVRKETTKPREEAFVCMFCVHAGHLDEFCFWHKRIRKRHLDFARNSYRDVFIDLPPHSYSCVPPRS